MNERCTLGVALSYWLLVAGCCAIIVAGIVANCSATSLLDDAYMYVRYADNLLAGRMLSWNPDGSSTYGLTSPLFLLVVVPLRKLMPHNASLTMILSSSVCGVAFLLLMSILVRRVLAPYTLVKELICAGLLFCVALSIGRLAPHFTSGMDTTFTLAVMAVYLLAVQSYLEETTRRRLIAFSVLGGMLYFVRPDLMLFALAIPGSMIVLGASKGEQNAGWLAFAVTATVLAGMLLLAGIFFGSVLPLPFYAKGLRLYGATIYAKHRGVGFKELLMYGLSWWHLFLISCISLANGLKKGREGLSTVEVGLLVAGALFLGYYSFFVLQIMHNFQRFYYPTLPALMFVTVFGVRRYVSRFGIEQRLHKVLTESPYLHSLAISLALVGVLVPSVFLTTTRQISAGITDGSFLNIDVRTEQRADRWEKIWFGLDAFSKLPDDLVLAATEVGHPAMMNPRKAIVDLTGLNDTYIAHNGFSARWLLESHTPDLIYMPHPVYHEMIKDIESEPLFTEHYDYYTGSRLGVKLGVAIRRESKYYGAMKEIVQRVLTR